MHVNPKPKIIIDEDYIDLRDQSDTLNSKPSGKGQKSVSKKSKSTVRTLNLKNEGLRYEKELINCGLKRLVTSYNNTANTYQRNNASKRKSWTRENTMCDPRFRRCVKTEEKPCLKSQSELSLIGKKIEKDRVSSSTPLFYSKNTKNKKAEKLEEIVSAKSIYTMTAGDSNNDIVSPKQPINRTRSKSRDYENREKNIGTTNTYRREEHRMSDCLKRNVDPRLKEKYSILKTPWKRSWTIPVFASKYSLSNKNHSTEFDRQTYLYDDGSEIDSSYVEGKHQNILKSGIPSQIMALLFIIGTACGILLASLLIYLIFGNNLVHIFFKPRELPENSLKTYVKYVGGGIIYVITSVFRTIGRVLSIPAQNIYQPPLLSRWPTDHLN